jgi:hypothetical protein
MGSPSTSKNDLRAGVFIGPFLPFEQGGGTFAATTSTLLTGSSVAVTIGLEGHELRIAEVGQGDIHPSTVIHIPDLDAVVAGDVVYNVARDRLKHSVSDNEQELSVERARVLEADDHVGIRGAALDRQHGKFFGLATDVVGDIDRPDLTGHQSLGKNLALQQRSEFKWL